MAKVEFEFDPFELLGIDPPTTGKRAKKAEVAEYVLDQVLLHVEQAKSPVRSGKWKRGLSKDYKARKLAQGGSSIADMELDGHMLDALEIVNYRGKLRLRIQGVEEDKADGHNNHSGKSRLPAREFIPKPDGNFKRSILQGMREILDDGED